MEREPFCLGPLDLVIYQRQHLRNVSFGKGLVCAEFRIALKGYNVFQVDEFLEKLAAAEARR